MRSIYCNIVFQLEMESPDSVADLPWRVKNSFILIIYLLLFGASREDAVQNCCSAEEEMVRRRCATSLWMVPGSVGSSRLVQNH